MTPAVFISYARAETAFAERLAAALLEAGKAAWLDTVELPPGTEWRDAVRHAIEDAGAFLFVVSPDSLRSEQCRNELEHALANGKPLVVLVRREPDPSEVPARLDGNTWIYARDEGEFRAAVGDVATAIG